MIFTLLLCSAFGYLIGSVPVGFLLTRWAGMGDLRAVGSGNIGATNVLRTGSVKLAALTLGLDMAKGLVTVILSMYIIKGLMPFADGLNAICARPNHVTDMFYDPCGYTAGQMEYVLFLAGAFAVIGHMFPIWLQYKGGKGVATFFGMMIAFSTQVGLLAVGTWLVVAIITKRSSLAALVSVALTPVYMALLMLDEVLTLFSNTPTVYSAESMMPILGTVALSILIFYRHRENIVRLMAGTEPKIRVHA